ncbi:MAG: nitroreductase family protein [Acidiferrobacterales bacterium]|nr:nitroreductase family protein [Acidiferrobacterales bacterium]
MDALSALHNRVSVNLLDSPAPSSEQLDNIFKAGLRACDHKNLRPWRFLVIQGEHRAKFGELMASVKADVSGESECLSDDLEKLKQKPFRAPTIVAVIADIKEHDKVPEIEQLLSAGAAAQMMMTAAFAQGLGAIWRSGSLMFEPAMHRGLGLSSNQKLVGFLYIGQIKAAKAVPELELERFVEHWS